ncbi:type I polyketide synthase [Alteromonas sp. ASW11-130]|uniref:type I polyketide synthase n=1 Tax=Alteromonas sp. ASW11-130 TaxID=3015775 RepID=UPI002241FE1D|nr:beta-ketoacyl synthase N-terminal-like domain-containing protein [Alteromonas sp. ASW11-130]MCW8091973.1 beta-ketoacyl synthase N-terminal-like domain-containing protein [Alteromonas sp. ASW11-130]
MFSQECSEFDVAIIGMAGRFPKAKNVQEYWSNLRDGVNSTRFASEEELVNASVSEEVIANPNFVSASIQLEDTDQFDAGFFQVSPSDAMLLDPQIRLLLQTSWHTLEDAGYDSFNYSGSIGNFCSMGTGDYLQRLISHNPALANQNQLQTRILNEKDFLATQVSYKLNLTGPAMTVQTACSSSLLAVHLACQSLISEECDMALAGGVQVDASNSQGYFYAPGSIMSPDGYCRAFDKQAQGTVQGNGVGMVLLKRLSSAIEDGDKIYAVIKGTAANNDGSDKMAYTAPNVDSQRDVILEALSVSDIDPDTIGLIEAHGTGTPIGDPVEMTALTEAYRQFTQRNQYCAIGSVKTNIGHLDAASGIASLIKAALCVHHGEYAPSLNYSEPNPALRIEQSPFYVCDQHASWESKDYPRRAGVSSFGVGGTNVHLVLEQAPVISAETNSQPYYFIPLSAKSPKALDQLKQQLVHQLETDDTVILADMEHTLTFGRHPFEYKFSAICKEKEQLLAQLKGSSSELCQQSVSTSKSDVVFMFPGQGSQYLKMAQGLYQSNVTFKQHMDACCELAGQYLPAPLESYIFGEHGDLLAQTEITQLAVFSVEYSLVKMWKSMGILPDAVTGHSLGEFTAACIAGVITLEDAIMLIFYRSKLMSEMPRGKMVSVNATVEQVEQVLCDNVVIAAINSQHHIVLAADEESMAQQVHVLTNQALSYKDIKTSHAFHSPMMEGMLPAFKEKLEEVEFHSPSLPFYSTLTGELVDDEHLCTSDYWIEQIRQPVLFAKAIRSIFEEMETSLLLEVGPGSALTSFSKATLGHAQIAFACLPRQLDSLDEVKSLLLAKSQLWHGNVKFDKPAFSPEQIGKIGSLPGTVFQTQSFWVQESEGTDTERYRQHQSLKELAESADNKDKDIRALKVGVRLSFAESEQHSDELISALEQAQHAFIEKLVSIMPEYGAQLQTTVESQWQTTLNEEVSEQAVEAQAAQSNRLTTTEYVAPQTEIEQGLAKHWQTVLGYHPVGINDDFFAVGGDSLTATTLLAKVVKEFQITLSFEDVAEAQTIAQLAKVIELRMWLKQEKGEELEEVFEI